MNNNALQQSFPPQQPIKKKKKKQGVDFAKLDIISLKKYRRQFNLKTRQNSSKSELVQVISKHFSALPVNESQVIDEFIESLKQPIPEDDEA